jgi:transcriptional regulator with XRE-family HTH domain
MDWRAQVGENVRRFRLARGWSQERLAFESSIDLTYLGGIERGRRNPSLLVMVRISHSLDVPLSALVTETEEGE